MRFINRNKPESEKRPWNVFQKDPTGFDTRAAVGTNSLDELAKLLVPAAHIYAVGGFVDVTKQFPLFKAVSTDEWDFFATVAGVYVGVSVLVGKIPRERFRELFETVIDPEVNRWNPEGCKALEPCMNFVGPAHKRSDLNPADVLGKWLVTNLLPDQDYSDELGRTVRQVGGLIAAAFLDWWADCPELTEG